jgi:hypothetical protein
MAGIEDEFFNRMEEEVELRIAMVNGNGEVNHICAMEE